MVSVHLIFLVFCVGGVLSALPKGWRACKQSEPEYEDCLKQQIDNAIQFFKNGDKKMGIIPLDPLHFDTMDVEQGSGPVSLTLKMKNVSFVGLSESRVTSVKNDWKTMNLTFHIPYAHNEGDYTINGQILVLPISGSGRVSMDWYDLSYIFEMTFKEITKDGKKYYQIEKIPVAVVPKKVSFNFGNLFNGNKELGDNTNKFLNEHSEEILNELKPAMSKTLEKGYRIYINRILAKIPAEEIDVK
ncbi:unnamed protein product [Nezara viridula]|uniref:Uncharacterized protein n=1 Tax=Nezara viridula TaxID=85310 RepID=A0A9P0H971_NEZVI|nr:unnamed protein product [Nezara viridula]CAH1397715.1 unnamed protein product [Nezara viridula]